jgi:ABC-type lipoprotein release transport system permease subunit
MEVRKHFLTRMGGTALANYLFFEISSYLATKTSGNSISLGFILSFLGIGSVLALLVIGLLIADAFTLHKKKKILLLNCNLLTIALFLIFLWYYIPTI